MCGVNSTVRLLQKLI